MTARVDSARPDGRDVRPDRRTWLTLALILTSTACGPSEPPPPNLVLITIDTLRADHLGCYGYPAARTPNIDRFATTGVRFDQATTVSNNTLPSHAAMLLGKHPHDFGIPRNGYRLPGDPPTLATILRSRGYRTAAFISATALESAVGLDRGFELFDEEFDVQEIDQHQRRAPATTRAVIEWLEARRGAPYFLWVHYFDPHYPYTPPEPYDELFYPEYEGPADGSIPYVCGVAGVKGFPKLETTPADLRQLVALYDGEIAFLDASLGELFEVLDAPEHRERTLVILTADHGESLTEHEYYFDHGELTYQPSMNVPLIVRPPGPRPEGAPIGVPEPVQTIDVFTTALAWLGAAVPEGTAGRDLTPLLLGQPGWVGGPSFGESCRPWTIEERYAGRWPNLGKGQFVLDWPWKLILTPHQEKVELYRLDRDPGELMNVADRHPHEVGRLVDLLQEWRRQAQAPASEQDLENMDRLRSLGYLGEDG